MDELADLETSLEEGRALASTLGELLRVPGRCLVLAVNNAEMGAGAGMPSSTGQSDTVDGQMRRHEMRSIADVLVPDAAMPG